MDEYLALGHMVPTSERDCTPPVYYLPHHGVFKESNGEIKTRVVFNASSRTDTRISLNDILHSGTKLQTEIGDVLLWIRSHRIVFSTDIVKMFRQIAVHPEDWKYQRIMWLNTEDQPTDYSLTTVTYGMSCAPFLALRCLQQLIHEDGTRFPKAVLPLTRGRYVDDIFGGADSLVEAREIMQQVVLLCDGGGFALQKWHSNCSELFNTEFLNTSERSSGVEIEPSLVKLLGLVWEPSTDTFRFSSHQSSSSFLSKRILLSKIAKFFDPLGLISPVLIRAKILIQELWLLKISWDDELPTEIHQRWTTFRLQLSKLEQLSVPRWLGPLRSSTQVELHGFSDDSLLALAIAVYVRVDDPVEGVSVRLICAKTRVAPLKRLSIPRLELSAALLLARLAAHVQNTLELQCSNIFLWTDSSVTLAWVNAHPS
ncbi:PREDICTED: uncharacterized protein LOC105570807 [Vollenhovia emeryi]|uniref:uncharacterized protein LOC105570807 n=1 Tax=Vollenhovia emeryi TaxID=411798 RepID=UPI0005F382C9|nr:PREDICTED: uncharacterized protein LOC105570807 [Vollenhovia emeryi]